MSWKPLIPVFNLLLVFLLAGDLGSNILVDANAIDCNYSWTSGGPSQIPGEGFKPYSCAPTGRVTYLCDKCGRQDKQIPSAVDCVTQEGKVVNHGGAWACDLLLTPLSEPRKDGRNFNCNQSATPDLYYCRSFGRPQQCPEGHCCVAGDAKCKFNP
ncbi:uncharacterized protein MELLADRAFT_123556 [Melampsora larici-populina 98AG31]|uniref:Secreted protein n=1 Tax=Melampsora larici-populina (strain 98AG31 / pathotype 3-4-7) TaxID=747676 RepID=F4RDN7_MELLP|nr:uncharacterized protein MELLADRAFT_123556 [Melampsora larici-populina 98AG31]EGG09573.1 secreted protein [Melampsora larici-populina 98AG31]